MKKIKNNLFVFEGIDGSGKTTTIKKLKTALEKRNYQVIVVEGIGSTSIGQQIRNEFVNSKTLTNEARFFLSIALLIQIEKEILLPNINKPNTIILVDRFVLSNLTYQAIGNSVDELAVVFNYTKAKFLKTKPTKTYYLDVEPSVGLVRKVKQENHTCDVIETKGLDYFQKVRTSYQDVIANKFVKNVVTYDTNHLTQEEIFKDILGEILFYQCCESSCK